MKIFFNGLLRHIPLKRCITPAPSLSGISEVKYWIMYCCYWRVLSVMFLTAPNYTRAQHNKSSCYSWVTHFSNNLRQEIRESWCITVQTSSEKYISCHINNIGHSFSPQKQTKSSRAVSRFFHWIFCFRYKVWSDLVFSKWDITVKERSLMKWDAL